jgi:hypothetical protein
MAVDRILASGGDDAALFRETDFGETSHPTRGRYAVEAAKTWIAVGFRAGRKPTMTASNLDTRCYRDGRWIVLGTWCSPKSFPDLLEIILLVLGYVTLVISAWNCNRKL